MSFQAWTNPFFDKGKVPLYSKLHARHLITFSMGFVSACTSPSESKTCYSPEHDEPMRSFAHRISRTLQPMVSGDPQCTLILLYNLAEPQWASVGCEEQLLTQVVCYSKRRVSIRTNVTWENAGVRKEICNPADLLFRNSCCHMAWHFSESKGGVKFLCRGENKSLLYFDHVSRDSVFHQILKATSVSHLVVTSYDPISSTRTFLTVEKLWTNMSVKTSEAQEGHFACVSQLMQTAVDKQNIFKCPNGEFISTVLVLDGKQDCDKRATDGSADEAVFLDPDGGSTASLTCHPLSYKHVSGECSFTRTTEIRYPQPQPERSLFTCTSGLSVETDLVNDLVSDCGVKADDERMIRGVLSGTVFKLCANPAHFPCWPGHPNCYGASEICIYRLNKHKFLLPCRTGSHLQNCEEFECTHHVKCIGSYCVPWAYTCDGKWDCPEGSDEAQSMCHQTNCEGMVRCSSSEVCLHTQDVCDGHTDCPLEDDEYLCSLSSKLCTSGCTCLNLAILCMNVTLLKIPEIFPHISIVIIHCNLSTFNWPSFNKFVLSLNVSGNSINLIPADFKYLTKLFAVDMSLNKITEISTGCFSDLWDLRLVKLNGNKISHLHANSFVNIPVMFVLNLANNSLVSCPESIFQNVTRIVFLNLVGCFSSLDSFVGSVCIPGHAEIVHTELDQICCFLDQDVMCTAQKRCALLLLNKFFEIMSLAMSLLVVLSNLAAILSVVRYDKCVRNEKKVTPDKRIGAYSKIILTTSAAYVSHGVCLLTLSSASLNFGKSFVFAKHVWKSGALCQMVFCLSVLHSLVVPKLLSLLCLARVRLVLKPMESRFKSPGVVFRHLICIILESVVFTCAFTLPFYISHGSPTELCSPFADTGDANWEVKFASAAVFLLQISCLLFTGVSYHTMIKHLHKDCQTLGKSTTDTKSICVKVALLTCSHAVSWIPSSVLHIVSLPLDSRELVLWATALLAPINPVVCPVFFIRTTTGKKRCCGSGGQKLTT